MSDDVMMYHPFFHERNKSSVNRLVPLLNGSMESIRSIREIDLFLGSEDSVKRCFERCEFAVFDVIEAMNMYWPDHYLTERLVSPWWVVMTDVGTIVIGRRKRVIEIQWRGCKLRKQITGDDVTSEPFLVHAWTEEKMFEYLKNLSNLLHGRITE